MNKYSQNYFKNSFQKKMIKELNSFTMNPSDKKGISIQINIFQELFMFILWVVGIFKYYAKFA